MADLDSDERTGSLASALGEKNVHIETVEPVGDADVELSRGLKGRHITMISLGGVLYVCVRTRR